MPRVIPKLDRIGRQSLVRDPDASGVGMHGPRSRPQTGYAAARLDDEAHVRQRDLRDVLDDAAALTHGPASAREIALDVSHRLVAG